MMMYLTWQIAAQSPNVGLASLPLGVLGAALLQPVDILVHIAVLLRVAPGWFRILEPLVLIGQAVAVACNVYLNVQAHVFKSYGVPQVVMIIGNVIAVYCQISGVHVSTYEFAENDDRESAGDSQVKPHLSRAQTFARQHHAATLKNMFKVPQDANKPGQHPSQTRWTRSKSLNSQPELKNDIVHGVSPSAHLPNLLGKARKRPVSDAYDMDKSVTEEGSEEVLAPACRRPWDGSTDIDRLSEDTQSGCVTGAVTNSMNSSNSSLAVLV